MQSEFAEERQMLFDYLTTDALLGKFFEPFVFENIPALNAAPATVFLQEVADKLGIPILGSIKLQ